MEVVEIDFFHIARYVGGHAGTLLGKLHMQELHYSRTPLRGKVLQSLLLQEAHPVMVDETADDPTAEELEEIASRLLCQESTNSGKPLQPQRIVPAD